ncbi:MAG TPA: fumarylacetoacetate hydrolase family protein [Myxococcota bacterium]
MSFDAEALAEGLRIAESNRLAIDKLTDMAPSMTVADAYAVQNVTLLHRREKGLHGKAARLVGRKVGITSKAVQEWLQVSEPDFGFLLDDMEVKDGGTCARKDLVQPRIEGEIAFVLKRELPGCFQVGGVTNSDVVAATDFVLPALEIIDSRIKDWKITYRDTVADNASSARYVVGTQRTALEGVDLVLAGMALKKNGRVASTGAGAACLGNPVTAVAWLANTLCHLGSPLRPGDLVLSGALGPVLDVSAGDFFELDVAHIGRCSVRFT